MIISLVIEFIRVFHLTRQFDSFFRSCFLNCVRFIFDRDVVLVNMRCYVQLEDKHDAANVHNRISICYIKLLQELAFVMSHV